jgi:hypothetical protein
VPSGGAWGGTNRKHWYEVPRDGSLRLRDLPAGKGLRVALQDDRQHDLVVQELTLADGEVKELRLAVPRPPRTLEGRVVAADGEPVEGAHVRYGGWGFGDPRTDAQGRFRIENVYEAEPALRITAAGFVPLDVRGDAELRRGTQTLEAARTLWVEVVDSTGRRSDAAVELVLDAGTHAGTKRGEGLYQVDGVPLCAGRVRARDAQKFRVVGDDRVDAAQTRVRVVCEPR